MHFYESGNLVIKFEYFIIKFNTPCKGGTRYEIDTFVLHRKAMSEMFPGLCFF